jgi:hypothetical protein
MRKVHLLWLSLCAVVAFGAVSAAAASAEELVWLLDEKPIAAAVETESTGEITLTDLGATGGASAVLCSGSFVGTVGPGKFDLITAVLDLAFNSIGALAPLTEGTVGLSCTRVSGACINEILVWAENLPWLTELVLMGTVEPLFLDLFTNAEGEENMGKPAWDVECKTLIGNVSDLCEGETSADLENDVAEGDVLGTFNQAELEEEGLFALCSLNGGNTGIIASDAPGLIFPIGANAGLTLAVSEE